MARPGFELSLALFAALLLQSCQAAAPKVALPGFDGWPETRLAIRSGRGRQAFRVLVADTPERQERGLMFVTHLPRDVGMLFPQDPPQVVHMWMKNTLIPLDMLFIDAGRHVVYIRANAAVESLELISTPQLTQSVLEIGGGEAARRGIRVGDEIAMSGPVR